MSDAKKDAAPPAAPAAAPAKSSKMMPILVALNSVLLLGVLGFMGYSMMHPPSAAAAPHGEKKAEGDEAKGEEHAAAEPKAEKAEKAEGKEEKKEGEGHGAAAGAAAGGPGPMVKLSDFVIHLRNPDLDRYVRMSFDIEVIADPDKDKLNANIPRVRDAIISYLSDRTLEELRGSEGLGRTKDALQQRLRELVPEARIRALYISDFVVQ